MKVCYFGIYDPKLGRSKIYIKGFKENGIEVIECRDNSRGIVKFVKLFLKHWKIRNDYDFMVVGYTGHITVPLAKIISRKKVTFDMCCALYEGVIISRKQYSTFSFRAFYIRFIDWIAVKFADNILLESQAQVPFFEQRFGKSNKYKVLYTGADDLAYYPRSKQDTDSINKDFTVVFRGKFLPEAGVRHVIEAAKILEPEGVRFLVIGNGFLEKEIKSQIAELKISTLMLITEYVQDSQLRQLMLSADVSLGQLEDHERLLRTIPHKCFETLALGLPYVTVAAPPIREILKDRENVFFVNPADPQSIADAILYLKNNPEIAKKIAHSGYEVFKKEFTPKVLAAKIVELNRK